MNGETYENQITVFFYYYFFPATQTAAPSSYMELAQYNITRREAIDRQAQIDAEADRLLKEDLKVIAAIVSGIGYCIEATGKFIFLREFKDNTEKTIGCICASALAIATAVGIHKLYGSYKAKQNNPTTVGCQIIYTE